MPDTTTSTTFDTHALPIGTVGKHSSGYYGMWCLIATEAALFAYLLFSYFYISLQQTNPWPTGGLPSLTLALPNTAILLLSSVAAWYGVRGVRRGSISELTTGLGLSIVLGTAFVVVQLFEWRSRPFGFGDDLYGSLFFTITGFHMAHVVVGLLVLAALLLWSRLGYFDRVRHAPVTIGTLYWHFVDAVWLAVFTSLYLSPYLR